MLRVHEFANARPSRFRAAMIRLTTVLAKVIHQSAHCLPPSPPR